MTAEEARAQIKRQADQLRRIVAQQTYQQEKARTNPPAHLMTSAGQWRVIAHGTPMTSDKATPAEAIAAALKMGAIIAPAAWNADRQQWVHVDTIEELTA